MNFRVLIFIFSFIFSVGVVQAQSSKYKTCKPRKGDGIRSMLRRYGLNTNKNYNEFLRINKKVLKGGTKLYLHKVYKLPTKSSAKAVAKSSTTQYSSRANYDALFGKKYAAYKKIDNRLKNAVYYIMSGHGGPDPGAQGKRAGHTLSEDEYVYDISLRLSRELKRHGASVYMIVRDANDGIRDQRYLKSDKDERVWKNKKIPLNQLKRLQQRTDVVNKLSKKHKGKYQRLLVLHIDSRSKSKRVDIFGYYHEQSKLGKRFANNLIKTLETNYKKAQPNREFTGTTKIRSNLYVVLHTIPPTCFLELGNIQNVKDQVRFTEPSNRRAIAEWLTQGCIKDFNQRNIK